MRPDDEIVYHGLGRTMEAYIEAGKDLALCDLVISQAVGAGHGPIESAILAESVPRLLIVPNLVFTGFQPDMTYLYHDNGCIVVSPVGAYHSRIIAACYSLGLGPIRTRKMFNTYVFELLDFFSEFHKARLNLEESMASQGLDLDLDGLFASGPFMHTINHANGFANRQLASSALRKVGLAPRENVPEIRDELLDDTVWPVYPEIAARLNLSGLEDRFLKSVHLATGEGASRVLTLDDMVERSFDIYKRCSDIDFSPVQSDAQRLRNALKRKYLLPTGSTRPLRRGVTTA